MNITVKKPSNGLHGEIIIPSDKSLSHRAIILSSLAFGKSVIKNFSKGQDPFSTLNVCKNLGINVEFYEEKLTVFSNGKVNKPKGMLNCGNSGTTMRLISGVLAAQNFESTLIGDESLTKRPMKRIIEPLTMMGAKIDSDNFHAPLKITGQQLYGIKYNSPLSSAQVKSAILLAGLFAEGQTVLTEPYVSRNHTELMLQFMNANIKIEQNKTTVEKSFLEPRTIEIAGDISSAAYFIAAGLIIPNSKIILKNVGLNPTRTGILDVLKSMGANIEILDEKTVSNELVGDLKIEYSKLHAAEISEEIIPRLIDEIPIIAVLATQAEGITIIRNAEDLRNKESDRIKLTVKELKKLGAEIEEIPDGMIINGKTPLKGNTEVNCHKDHRLAMSLYTAGLISQKEILIHDFEWVNISFPEFLNLFNELC